MMRVLIAVVVMLVAMVAGWGAWFRQPSPKVLRESAQELFEQHEFSAAADLLERVVRQDPKSVEAWRLLAECRCRQRQPADSQLALERYARLEPTGAAELSLSLGTFWMNQNRIRPAIAALRLSADCRRRPEPYRLLAQIYGITGHRRETVDCLMELVRLEAFTRQDLIVLSSVNPTVDDPQRLRQLMLADPDDKAVRLPQAMSELDHNRIDAALTLLSEIVSSAPDDTEAQSILGFLYSEHRPREFLAWNAKLPPSAESDGRIWLARGKWLQQAGQNKSAVRCLHEALTREPENLSATMLMGELLKSLGRTELGNEFTERARRLQKVSDLNARLLEPRGAEWIVPMIDELEATGQLWEANAWCFVYEREVALNDALRTRRVRLLAQLGTTAARTIPAMIPGAQFDWSQFPLPDWPNLDVPSDAAPEWNAAEPSTIHFESRSLAAGLDFRYLNLAAHGSGHKIYETMGTGVAVLDFDRDEWPDLYFPQGSYLGLNREDAPSDALYRNSAGLGYSNVTNLARIDERGFSQGVTAGDYDNDGFPDLYVANLGRNRLFHNQGDGTFLDVTIAAGLEQAVWTTSCAIADLNGDGFPELFDVNYVQSPQLLTTVCTDALQRPVVCRPTLFDPILDTVSLNQGDGRFQQLQGEAGLDLPQGMGLGILIADFNDDNRLDLFIANDMTANFLLINELAETGQLRFRDEAFQRGVALDSNGLAQACMGIASNDLNRDGVPDLFVTNFAKESNTLYLSQPGGLFQDLTQVAGLREPSFEPLGFGAQFLDADRDGWMDLIVMNGHIDEFLNEPFRMKPQIFRGQQGPRFTELFVQAGEIFNVPALARGLATLDWNRDGRTDFIATDLEQPVLLAENTSQDEHHSLRLKLVGTVSSRDAIGARVRVTLNAHDVLEVQLTAGDGYESCNERVIEIGTAKLTEAARVDIRWPSGTESHFEHVPCDHSWIVIEGSPTPVALPVN